VAVDTAARLATSCMFIRFGFCFLMSVWNEPAGYNWGLQMPIYEFGVGAAQVEVHVCFCRRPHSSPTKRPAGPQAISSIPVNPLILSSEQSTW
jgi:hypothetical protein